MKNPIGAAVATNLLLDFTYTHMHQFHHTDSAPFDAIDAFLPVGRIRDTISLFTQGFFFDNETHHTTP